MDIGYKYNYRRVLVFIATEGAGSNEPGDSYLSRLSGNYSNVSFLTIVFPCMLCSYFNACNAIDNHNSMLKSGLELDKYLVKQSSYFRLATTVDLGMIITGSKLLFDRGISEITRDKKIGMRE